MPKYTGIAQRYGQHYDIFCDGEKMSMVDVCSKLSDLQHENERLKQRISNIRDKMIRFAEKELTSD